MLGRIAILSLAALAASACSVLPAWDRPSHREVDLVVQYEFGAGGPQPIEVPASDERLTVLELRAVPQDLAERFVNGRRMLMPTPGTGLVELHCRYRVYDNVGGVRLPDPRSLFPGATRIQSRSDFLTAHP